MTNDYSAAGEQAVLIALSCPAAISVTMQARMATDIAGAADVFSLLVSPVFHNSTPGMLTLRLNRALIVAAPKQSKVATGPETGVCTRQTPPQTPLHLAVGIVDILERMKDDAKV